MFFTGYQAAGNSENELNNPEFEMDTDEVSSVSSISSFSPSELSPLVFEVNFITIHLNLFINQTQ